MAKRTCISDDQRDILERVFRRRDDWNGSMFKEMVLKVSTNTDLMKVQVEVNLIIFLTSAVALYQVVPHFISIIPRIKQN